MNSLGMFYSFFTPTVLMIERWQGRRTAALATLGVFSMLVSGVMRIIGTVGVACYVRFLVAIWKEGRRSISGYWVRLHVESEELPRPIENPKIRAA